MGGKQFGMLLVIPFCRKDRQLAERQAEWVAELGPYPAHQLLSVRDVKAAPIDYNAAGFYEVKEIVVRDAPDSWPEGPNTMFARAGKQIEHVQKVPWLWCEVDSVPMRTGWLDEIEAEYAKALQAGKVFLGDLQRPLPGKPHFVPHSSGLCVYPSALTQYAGEAYMAGNVPFDTVAGPSVVPKMMQSELLYHVWKAPPFESWADVERRIFAVRPKCAVFHSDKSGSLLGLLRERKNFSGSAESRRTETDATGSSSRDATMESGSSAPPAENPSHEPTLLFKHIAPSLMDSSESVIAAENNLPVPVLADRDAGCKSRRADQRRDAGRVARESTSGENRGPEIDSRGGQFISEPDSAAEPVPLGGTGAHGIECTCLKPDFPCPFHFRDYEGAVFLPPEIKCHARPLKLSESNAKTIILETWMGQTPWASKADSIAEIRQLAARLMQFSDSSPHVRLVRAELHDAGVIRLDYRYRKRRGWKRKKGSLSAPVL